MSQIQDDQKFNEERAKEIVSEIFELDSDHASGVVNDVEYHTRWQELRAELLAIPLEKGVRELLDMQLMG